MASDRSSQKVFPLLVHGLPNAKSQRFSYATSQIAVVALNRKSQLDTLRFDTQSSKSHWKIYFSVPNSRRFKSRRLTYLLTLVLAWAPPGGTGSSWAQAKGLEGGPHNEKIRGTH